VNLTPLLATTYQLQEQLNGGDWSTIHDAAGSSKAISGKAAGSWAYRIRACNAATCGSWSPVAFVTVQLPPATVPTLTAPGTGLNGIFTVSWGEVTAATKYQLQERLGAGSWVTIHDASGGSMAISGKSAGSWSYQIRACNDAGCGGWSAAAAVDVVYPPGSAPALTVPATSSSGSYDVTWGAIGGSTRYELQEQLEFGSWALIHSESGTSKAVSGKTTGTWGYQARACNAAGCGGWSAASSVVVTRAPTDIPALTVPATSTTGSYSVSWTSVTHATSYQLQERMDAGGWSTLQDASSTSSALDGRTTGVWGYQVRACNVAGCGGWSAANAVTVTRPPPVPAITFSRKNQHYVGQLVHIQCSVSWAPVASADRYELQVHGGGLQYSGPLTSVSGSYNTASYCAPSHVLRACNVGGCSAWSSPPHLQELVEYGSPGGPEVPVSIEINGGGRP